MCKKRKYTKLVCEICKSEYLQDERHLTVKWKNRCPLHRGCKYSVYEEGLSYDKPLRCSDCKKPIYRGSEKCKSCSQKITRQDKYCIDCGKQITRLAKNRCLPCHNKKQDKGLSTERIKFNNSDSWNKIRIACFVKDNYTCQICDNRGGYLNAHHIHSYHKYPLLRLNLKNLITLCWDCHLKLHHNKEFKLKYKRYAS